MVKEIQADFFSAPVDCICHGANAQHTMGSGIAKAIREHYPEAYEADCEQTKKGDRRKMGTFSEAKIPNPEERINPRIKYIFNLYTQFFYGRDRRHLDYESIYSAFEKLKTRLAGHGLTLGINYKIGCSLAGGDFRVVRAMIDVVFENADFDVLICRRPGD